MLKNLLFITVTFFISAVTGFSQNPEYVKHLIDRLASEEMHGRGYLHKGDSIAASFLAEEMNDIGLHPFMSDFFQPYSFPMNVFPGRIRLMAGTSELNPGVDYVINCSSPATDNTFKVLRIARKEIRRKSYLKKLSKKNLENTIILLDDKDVKEKEHKDAMRYIHNRNPFRAGAVFMLTDKSPIWSVSDCRKVQNYVKGSIVRDLVADVDFINIRFQNVFINSYKTANLAGFIRGSEHPDSFIVFMAHYDHLGRMGDSTLFPGANDNASGTATVLDLARHYTSLSEPPKYTIAFLLFSGEEAGLLGSTYFAENPLIPLENIRFAVNLDMVGTGSEGIRVVNGNIHAYEMDLLRQINDSCEYLPEVGGRGESANSDHYPFHARGVKTFFIFTLGKEHRHYHSPKDVPETLPLTGYEGLFRLLTGFADKLQYHE